MIDHTPIVKITKFGIFKSKTLEIYHVDDEYIVEGYGSDGAYYRANSTKENERDSIVTLVSVVAIQVLDRDAAMMAKEAFAAFFKWEREHGPKKDVP